MRRTQRRLWTIVLTTAATLMLLLALAVGAFRLLVALAPEYRQDLAGRVSAQLGREVAINSMNVTWRGLHPSLDLVGVNLMGDDKRTPVLHLTEMNISVAWLPLLAGRVEVAELRLVGPTVTVERLADGSLRLSGIDRTRPLTMADLQNIANQMAKIGRLVIAKGQMFWVDVEDPNTFQRVNDINVVFSAGGQKHRLKGHATLPGELGGTIELMVHANGPLEDLPKVQSEVTLLASGLQAGIWLQPYLRPGVRINGSGGEIEISSEWLGGQLRKANGKLSTGKLLAEQAGTREEIWQDFRAKIAIAARDTGWHADLTDVSVKRASAGPSTTTGGSLDYLPGANDSGPTITVALSSLQLDDFSDWLKLLNPQGRDWLSGLNPKGQLQDISFQFQRPATSAPTYHLQCRLDGVGVDAVGTYPGVAGMRAALDISDSGGQVQFDVKQGQFLAPHVLDKPLPIQMLTGTLQWQRDDAGWNMKASELLWQGPGDIKGGSAFTLQLPADGSSPVIDLDTNFTGNDLNVAKPFIPRVKALHESVRAWLARSLVRGAVTRGVLKMRGRLNDFPYENAQKPGLFQLEMDVRNGVLDYVPGWPRVEDLSAQLLFQGRSMHISNGTGRILGTPQTGVTTDIDDFLKPVLEVHGQSTGDAGHMLSFLTESPLRVDYEALVQALKLRGPAHLDLSLSIPLEDLKATQVHGVVSLDGQTQLVHAKLPQPVTGLTGQVMFDREGLHSKDLRGDLMGLKLAIQLSPKSDEARKLTQLTLQTQVAFPRDAAELAKQVPANWLQYFKGSSQWQADMLFDSSASLSKLHLQSDMVGLETTLPKPLDKMRDDVKPLTILLDPSHDAGMRADLNFGDAVSAAMLLGQTAQGWTVQSAMLHLGPGPAALPTVPGIWVEGTLPELDAGQWQALLSTPATPASAPAVTAAPATQAAGVFKGGDIRLGRLIFSSQALLDVHLQLVRRESEWLLTATGPALEGVIRWPQSAAARPIYRADLVRLALRAPEPTTKTTDQAKEKSDQPKDLKDQPKEKPMDPSQLPGLSLRCRNLKLNNLNLGSLQMEVFPVAKGLRLETVVVNGDAGQIQGSGDWMRADGLSSGHLTVQGNSPKIRELMTALGYSPSLQAEKAKLNFDIAWAPHADGLVPQSIGGNFKLDLEKGALLAVSPGYGRVLGLLNFYALPRRLTLDFRDVVSEGYTFDTLNGSFRITRGDAYTENLKMNGPAAKMKIKGHVGLADHTYDQVVTIQPQVSSGVAVAGVALGGPAVGAMLLLVQQLFKKPLNEVSELSYHLGGTWENPDIQKGDSVKPAKHVP